MYLITGITGHVGGAAATHLLAAGKQVRALVRDKAKAAKWAEQGVELVQGDWTDVAALTSALEGVEGAYIMMPPIMTPSRDFREAKAIAKAYVDALTKATPKKVVALSSIGSEKDSKLGLITSTHILEQALKGFAAPIAFVRAGSFMENYLYGLDTAQGGILPVMMGTPEMPVPMIATKDIGAEVAKLLTSDWEGKRIIELGSVVTPAELAQQLGEAIGRDVQPVIVPRDQWSKAFEQMGLPGDKSWAYQEMLESINNGWIAFGVEGTEKVEGTTEPKDVFASAKAKG